ncbi:GNAT family N-acetyltransferase [Aquimarina sp. 2201CG5-10]|uniref:GNAT family N-acetyltransferase n=1 Tax=Aquimarina callyspongiae TaxID=3098150 RepID=UPI002AB43BCC|nr:GNAT family N-acetyltransferase [Aquimarina sp. 2201CG5-10]MDY8134454.1 GNAT family N-acetyltransferase [Aquimarina sp. 2201CG5-10]
MKIQKALRTDAEEITELTIRSKSYWGYSKEQIEEWRDDLTITPKYIDDNEVYRLVENETLIGFYAYNPENKTDVKLNFLFIDPESIGKGFGKILITDFLHRVEKTDFKRVILDADPNAEKFYLQMGFQVIGKLKSSIKDRFLPIMAMDLKKPTT